MKSFWGGNTNISAQGALNEGPLLDKKGFGDPRPPPGGRLASLSPHPPPQPFLLDGAAPPEARGPCWRHSNARQT